MKAKSNISIYFALGLAILAVSTASIFIRFAQREASSFVIAAYRMAIAALILAPITLIRKWKEFRSISRNSWFLMILSGVLLACHFATWITSLEKTSVASSVVIVTTTPLWAALFSPIFLKEKITRYILIGLVIALIGGIIVGLNQFCSIEQGKITCQLLGSFASRSNLVGNLLALAGAIFASGYIMTGRAVRKTVSLEIYIFLVYGIAALVLVILVLATHKPFVGFSKDTYFYLVLLALIPQLLGHSTYNWALKYLSAVFVSIGLLGEPIGSAILAMIFLKEIPTIFEIVGGVLILAGIAIAARIEGRNGDQTRIVEISSD